MENNGRKVLVIDDAEEIRDLVDVSLRGSEFEVIGAAGGREGIQLAKEIVPDIILLDIMMPGFDGFMTASVIKRNPVTRDIPVVFLSAKKSKEDIQQAIKSGGLDYIVKPFTPTDLMTRLRKRLSTADIIRKKAEKKQNRAQAEDTADAEMKGYSYNELIKQSVIRRGDVVICRNVIPNLTMKSHSLYRGIFSNIISDGVFKVVFDTAGLESIDGAGLALLISVENSLVKYGGKLKLTMPQNDINNRFTFIKLNDIFKGYTTSREALESFSDAAESARSAGQQEDINLCTACTYVNIPEARYCSYCGANLMLGGSEQILKTLKQLISRKLMMESQTADVEKLNSDRAITADDEEIPSDFDVEIVEPNLLLKYRSSKTVRKFYVSRGQIAIQTPILKNIVVPVQRGMKVLLSGTQPGMHSAYETEIRSIDTNAGMMFVNYSDDAKVIHSMKNFSVAPAIPIPLSMQNPSIACSDDIIRGKILEISRVRMVVFSEAHLSEDECLAVQFELPHFGVINSPLVMAQKRREKFMYELEFIVIDERERSRIIQYMYGRQIEMAKVISDNR